MNEQAVVDDSSNGCYADQRGVLPIDRLQLHSCSESRRSHRLKESKLRHAFSLCTVHTVHIESLNQLDHLMVSGSVVDAHCVEALEKVFWGQLTPAVLHIHAPIKLSIFTTCKTNCHKRLPLTLTKMFHVFSSWTGRCVGHFCFYL